MKFTYEVLTKDTAHQVASVIKKVYGGSYSELALPTGEEAWDAHESGDNIIVLAFFAGQAQGMVSLKRSPDNMRVYELGMLSVDERFRDGEMAGGLIAFVKERFGGRLDYDAVYMENVSNHYYSQRKAAYSGSIDSAIMLFAMQGLSSDKKRLSFITGFMENPSVSPPPVYVPKRYSDVILLFYHGFKKRSFLPLVQKSPYSGATLARRREFPTLGLLKESITDIGADFSLHIDMLDDYTNRGHFTAIQIFLPMASEHLSFAVDVLHEKGYVVGGVMPLWFGADAFFMQKTVWEDLSEIKVYSKKAKKILQIIKEDKV